MVNAVVIGAGAGGLCAAVKLLEAGVDDLTIIERGTGLGGTWRDNTYPGAACDVPSHLYSFSFDLKKDWSRKFAEQPEILDYFEGLADRYDLRRRIRFNSEVASAAFDESSSTWEVRMGDGSTLSADVLVCAVGQLSRPSIPEIAGLDTFAGDSFHSAQWNHDLDLHGKRVAVIGNGASAVQFVPPVAAEAASLTVFQRSANWIMPKPDRPYTARERRVFASVPGAARAMRWYIYARLELNYMMMRKRNPLSALLVRAASKQLAPLASDKLPIAALIPDFPPGCKRILISNDYYKTLLRPNVDVELDPIDHIESDGIITASGIRHPADVIIFGTGFQATRFLTPMEVTGRGGVELSDVWQRGAKAHLGVEVAGFPNFFIMYGPNTNLGHNSILFMIEAQSRYMQEAVRHLIHDRLTWLEIRSDVMDRFNAELQVDADKTVWASDCTSWYKNSDGVVTNNWPAPSSAYWLRMRSYRTHEHIAAPRRASPETGPEAQTS